jgi:hypothetical protein
VTIEAAGKIWIGHAVVKRTRGLIDQRGVVRGFVVLRQGIETVLQPIRSRKLPVQRIKTPILLINDDDMS